MACWCQVALKQLSLAGSDASLVWALRELALMRRLRGHPNILALVAAEVEPISQTLLIAADLCAADLQEVLHSTLPLRAGQRRWLLWQLLAGLAHAHAIGISPSYSSAVCLACALAFVPPCICWR